jgi:6-phosphogluconolactonase
MPAEIVVLQDRAQLARAVSARIARAVETAVAERQWCFLAMPGGPFVRPIYDELIGLQLPWSEVEFYFTDERCVPVSHPASNYGEAADRLLRNPRIGEHQLHRIDVDDSDSERAADHYAEELPEVLDLTLLEVGADGHVASLFPGSAAFAESERRVLPVDVAQKPRRRITLAPGALCASREVLAVAQGADRARAVQRAVEEPGDPREWPARIARGGTWFLDPAAASLLEQTQA